MTILDLGIKRMIENVPNNIKMIVDKAEMFDFSLPIEGDIVGDSVDALSINNNQNLKGKIHIDLNKPFSLQSDKKGAYIVDLKLFGVFTLKQMKIDVIDTMEIIPSGMPIGIYVNTDGVLVLGTGEVAGMDGLGYEPALNILKSGDYIVAVNEVPTYTISNVTKMIEDSDGKSLKFRVRRNGEEITLKIKPVKSTTGDYKIGAWIREDTQGIGTLTYVTTDGKFGALGHPITDIDTGTVLEIHEGSVYTTQIVNIVKGEDGAPGEIIGVVNQNAKSRIGNIFTNTSQGIFGELCDSYINLTEDKPMEIGLKQDVKVGKAYIKCKLDSKMEYYEIQIEKINLNSSAENKGMVIRITDKRLLNVTNGIIQGMSGSPIIQNNKIIGAVTHVFIQDSTKGYGTFIENMIINSK
jgi:stage IV sporulation protein B